MSSYGCQPASQPLARIQVPATQIPKAAPWEPKANTKLPASFIATAKFMLAHGLPDPRGCRFVYSNAMVAQVWSGGDKRDCIGWVLPEKVGGKEVLLTRNGAVVPLLKEIHLTEPKQLLSRDLLPQGIASLRFDESTTTTAILLAIAGEEDLALQVMSKVKVTDEGSLFNLAATSFLSASFDQAVGAHMRGDDAFALATAERIEAFRKDYVSHAEVVMKDFLDIQRRGYEGTGMRYEAFGFLSPLPVLVEDSRRRLSEGNPPAESVPEDPDGQVRYYVDRLDEVAARQMGQPGGVLLSEDANVKALIGLGERALPSLFQAVRKDRRLTRSVSFGRDFFPQRNLISVRDAAVAAIQNILGVYDLRKPDGTVMSIDELEAFGKKTAGNSQEVRWLTTLREDSAGADRWAEAAQALCDPQNVNRLGMGSYTVRPATGETPRHFAKLSADEKGQLAGLLERRLKQIVAESDANSSMRAFAHEKALRMAKGLLLVEPRALATAREEWQRAVEDAGRLGASSNQTISSRLSSLTSAMMDAGDSEVLPKYTAWLKSISPRDLFGTRNALLPFTAHPNFPQVLSESRQLLLDKGSQWSMPKLLGSPASDILPVQNRSSWRLETFRTGVIEALRDTRVVGTMKRAKDRIIFQGQDGSSSGTILSPKGALSVGSQPLRVCDCAMAKLGNVQIKGLPEFNAYASPEQRDRQIATVIRFIEANDAMMADRISEMFEPLDL